MPDAHAAAVEAMAGALSEQCRLKAGGECVKYARVALAALVRSEAVRAALVEAAEDAVNTLAPGLAGEFDAWRDFFHDAAVHGVEAILAALAPEVT